MRRRRKGIISRGDEKMSEMRRRKRRRGMKRSRGWNGP